MIVQAYKLGEMLGLPTWCADEAGPYQAIPQPGESWQPVGKPALQPHEYVRGGTAKLLTLFRPATGEVRAEGVKSASNAVLHPWLKEELTQILASCPPPKTDLDTEVLRAAWEQWYAGLSVVPTLPDPLPPLRMLLIQDNLAGHKTPEYTDWCYTQGIMLLYTPLGGSWLNMAESVQRILQRRALDGQHPLDGDTIIEWLEATVRGWNQHPTPFIWGGKRATRRERARQRRHALGGSGACTNRPVRRRPSPLEK